MKYFEAIRIPKFFGMFKNLRYLNLSSTSIVGDIPPHLGIYSSLNYLDLYSDSLIIPECTNYALQTYDGSRVSLPRKILTWDKLNYSTRDQNNCKSSICLLLLRSYTSIGVISIPFHSHFHFTLLSVLDLSQNILKSSIPNWLFNLTSLTKLDLSLNYPRVTFPENTMNFLKHSELKLKYQDS